MSNELQIIYEPDYDLTPKQEQFCLFYIKYKNATKAAKLAGYSESTARVIGAENLLKPDIRNRIAELTIEMNQRHYIDADEVIKRLAWLGKSDIRDYYDEEGALIPIHELSEEAAFAIQQVETLEVFDRNGVKTGEQKKAKLADKKGALQLLGQHFGTFNKDTSNRAQVVIFNFDKEDEAL